MDAAAKFGFAEPDYIYTRINNPTQTAFEERMNALEGGIGALAASSGATAVTVAIETILKAGDHILSQQSVCGVTYNLFKNTGAVLQYLESNPYAAWVRHPCVKGNRCKALANRYFPREAGAILSFGFKETEEQKRVFFAATKIFSYQANIGDARSRIINPAQTTHVELTPEQRKLVGLSADTIRLSLGLESAKDLIADLEQAFHMALGKSQ